MARRIRQGQLGHDRPAGPLVIDPEPILRARAREHAGDPQTREGSRRLAKAGSEGLLRAVAGDRNEMHLGRGVRMRGERGEVADERRDADPGRQQDDGAIAPERRGERARWHFELDRVAGLQPMDEARHSSGRPAFQRGVVLDPNLVSLRRQGVTR